MLRRLIAFTNSVGKGFYWTVLVLAFGLVQFWIALGDHYAKGNLDWYELTLDGGLLFFALAVTAGVMMDYHFDQHPLHVQSLWKATAFSFVPSIVSILAVASYFVLPTATDHNLGVVVNVGAACLATAYAVAGKTYLFYKAKVLGLGE